MLEFFKGDERPANASADEYVTGQVYYLCTDFIVVEVQLLGK